MSEDIKKIMFVMRKAPYGTVYPFEGLEAVLILGAYEQDISLLFIDDGVLTIMKGTDTTALGIKNFSSTFRALEGYDIEKLYIDKDSMESRGLTVDDFVVEPEILDREQIGKLMEEQDALLPF